MKKDLYYFHNVQATVLFSFNSQVSLNWLSIKGNGFSFYENRNKQRKWLKASYFPISVRRNGKPWADFDIQRKKIHIETKGDFENQLNIFIAILKPYLPDLVINNTRFKYVEVCTRYLDKNFDEVSQNIKKAEARYFTTDRHDSIDKRIKGKIWMTIGRKLYIDNTSLNLKTYRFVEEIKTRKRRISDNILPKIEVQIYYPKNLDEAREKAIPIIKAFQEGVGFDTESMEGEPDYMLIQDTPSLYHNTKVLKVLKGDKSNEIVVYPREITEDELVYKIACYITPIAKNSHEIMEFAHINRAKLAKVIKKLEPYLEKRGNRGIGIFYQIDEELIKNNEYSNNTVDVVSDTIPNFNTKDCRASESNTKLRESSNPFNLPTITKNIHSQKLIVQKPTRVQFSHQ